MLINLYTYNDKKKILFNFLIFHNLNIFCWYFKKNINYLVKKKLLTNYSNNYFIKSIFFISKSKNAIFYKSIKIFNSNSYFIKKNYFFFINFYFFKNFNFFYWNYQLYLFSYFSLFFKFFFKKNKLIENNLLLV